MISDGNPLDVKLIDYQVLRLLHPTVDLGLYLYISTDLPFREAHEKTILEEYFKVLNSYISPHYTITLDEFLAQFEAKRPGFTFAGIVLSLLKVKPLVSIKSFLFVFTAYAQCLGA